MEQIVPLSHHQQPDRHDLGPCHQPCSPSAPFPACNHQANSFEIGENGKCVRNLENFSYLRVDFFLRKLLEMGKGRIFLSTNTGWDSRPPTANERPSF